MTDAELIARWDDYVESMGSVMGEVEHMAQQMRDRIEALTAERDDYAFKLADANNTYSEMHVALSEANDKLATCEKYRDAYAECDKIGTQAVRELEAKLAKAVEVLEAWGDVAVHCSIEEGVCCCGDNMENHTNPMDCGHTPLDHGTYIAIQLAEKTRATLAEIKGESHD
jgi:hypothetical protein